jgi:hypothetical protein
MFRFFITFKISNLGCYRNQSLLNGEVLDILVISGNSGGSLAYVTVATVCICGVVITVFLLFPQKLYT